MIVNFIKASLFYFYFLNNGIWTLFNQTFVINFSYQRDSNKWDLTYFFLYLALKSSYKQCSRRRSLSDNTKLLFWDTCIFIMSNSTIVAFRLVPFICGSDNFLQCRIAVWIWKICPIALVILGTIANCLNVLVLSRRRLRKYPNTTFLLFLAVSDCVFLWTVIGRILLLVYTNTDIRDLSVFNCIMYN